VIRTDNGWVPVEEVYDTGEYEKVYNVRVAEFHPTSFGEEEWGFSVWAHNTACDENTQSNHVFNRGLKRSMEGVASELSDYGAWPNLVTVLQSSAALLTGAPFDLTVTGGVPASLRAPRASAWKTTVQWVSIRLSRTSSSWGVITA